jgi:hypothetical protein
MFLRFPIRQKIQLTITIKRQMLESKKEFKEDTQQRLSN